MEHVPAHTAPSEDLPHGDVQFALDARLVARAKALDGNLSRTLNRALEAHLRRHERSMTDEQIHDALEAVNERHAQYGVMSDEFGDTD